MDASVVIVLRQLLKFNTTWYHILTCQRCTIYDVMHLGFEW